MALRKRPIAAGITALIFSSWVSALGLGELKLNSALNEPLDAEIRLLNVGELGEAEILAGLAPAVDYANAGIDREQVHNSLVFRLDFAAAGGPLLRVMSNKPIREPYLDLLVDVQWPSGRLLREYTLLLDLPVFSRESSLERAFQAEGAPRSTAPAPRPRYTAPADFQDNEPPPVASGDEYLVNSGDTLWSIASRISGNGSVHRTMSAIHQLNPDAFIGGDINLLRSGHVLRLPVSGQTAALETPDSGSLPAPTADRPVVADVASSEQSEMLAPQLSATSRAPSAEDPGEAEPSGRLRLSAIDPNTANETDYPGPSASGLSAANGAGGGQAIRAELSTIQEEMARTQRENAELKDRLANLEEQLSTMQRLIEIDDGGLRAAQLAAADGAADRGVAGEASTAPPAQLNQQIKSEKGWFDTVSSYLVYAIGVLVLLIGGVVFAVLKKRRGSDESQEDYFPPVAERVTPPVRVVERQVADAAPQASSLDDIDLREDDDIFAAAAAPAARSNDQSRQERVESSLTEADASPDLQQPSLEESDDVELDLSEFELDDFQALESTSAPGAQQSGDPLNLDDEFDFLNDADEGDTQLELAQAYIDMGDAAGAREILQEVIESGSDAHKDLARSLLAKIS